MIQTIDLLARDKSASTRHTFVPTPTKCVIFTPHLAITCDYFAESKSTFLYSVIHIPTGGRIWFSSERKLIISFIRDLISLDLNWDFKNPDLVPVETIEKIKPLISRYQDKADEDDEDEGGYLYELALEEIRQIRIQRKLAQKRQRKLKEVA